MFRKWTYEEYFNDMNTAAKGFIELGLNPHRTVAIIGKVKQNFSSIVGWTNRRFNFNNHNVWNNTNMSKVASIEIFFKALLANKALLVTFSLAS